MLENSMKCPSCGAMMKPDVDGKYVTCEFCGASYAQVGETRLDNNMPDKKEEASGVPCSERQQEIERREEVEYNKLLQAARKDEKVNSFLKNIAVPLIVIGVIVALLGICNRIMLVVGVVIVVIGLLCFIPYGSNKQKAEKYLSATKITITPKIAGLCNHDLLYVEEELCGAGFSNFEEYYLGEPLEESGGSKNGVVERITFCGMDDIQVGDVFSEYDPIIVYYRAKV